MTDPNETGPYLATHVSLPSEGLTKSPRAAPHPDIQGQAVPLAPPGYEVLGELGRGGMGVVYRARQTRLDRIVALKMILAGPHAGAAELTRFGSEAEAVARLQHPNVVQIFETGTHDGLPFMALEYVEGGSLADKVKEAPLPANQAARIVEQLARGLAYAHSRGVVHRDLKPANVLLALGGAGGLCPATSLGTPKVADFGLAKRVDVGEGLTATGAVMGTPSYMAPEQAAGGSKEVGPAADVYALGAILYRLVTGRPPFQAATALETLRHVLEQEPAPPSRLNAQTPRDLETICLKCLRKEPAQRYASAEALAEDLRRFQAGEPVRARPVGGIERTWKWVKRRPVAAGLVSVTALLLLALAVLAVGWLSYNEVQTAQREEARLRGLAETAQKKADQQRALAVAARTEADSNRQTAEAFESLSLVQAAHHAWQSNDVPAAVAYLDQCRHDLRGWEYHYVRRLCTGSQLTLQGDNFRVNCVAFSPDGKRIASGGASTVNLWDAATGQQAFTFKGHTHVLSVCFSPDGKRLASASFDKTVKLWDADQGRELLTLKGHTAPVYSVVFSLDGKRLASASFDKTVKLWDADQGHELLPLKLKGDPAALAGCMAFSPDRKRIVAGKGDRTARVWDTATGEELLALKGHADFLMCAGFSADGRRILTGSVDRTVKVWDADQGQELLTLKGHAGDVRGVAFSSDGKRIVTAGADRNVKVWDADKGVEILSLKGHTDTILGVAVSPDGKRIASGSADRTVKMWDADQSPEAHTLPIGWDWPSGALRADGKRIACASGGPANSQSLREVGVWDTDTGQEVLTLKGHTPRVMSVAFSADGKRIASASADFGHPQSPGEVRVWDAATGMEVLARRGHAGPIWSVALSNDGKRIVTGSSDRTAKVWDADTGEELLTLKGHADFVTSVAFSPDGKRIASIDGNPAQPQAPKHVRVWDADTGREILKVRISSPIAANVAFSPDGKHIVTGSDDRTVKVWDVDKGHEVLTLKGHTQRVRSVAFSADGKRIATAGEDRTIRVWHAELGHEALCLKGHTDIITQVAFSADGKRITSASRDRTVKLWDAAPGTDQFANPHKLFLFVPEVRGLEVVINGAADEKANVRRIVWNWGDRTLETESFFPAQHRYAKAGLYHVHVATHDEAGRTSSATTTVTVGAAP